VNSLTPVVNVNPCDVAELPELLTRITLLESAVEFESKTLTLIPSTPSTIASEVAVTLKVVELEPAAIVAEPDRTSTSVVDALSTVVPLLSPITVQEKFVSEATAELAVIVNVTELPSSTLEADLVTVKDPPPVDQAVPLTETLEAPATEPEAGRVATPARPRSLQSH
jgi:hypothetical protein